MANDISDFLVGVLVHSVDVQDVDSAGDLLKRIRGLYCWLEAILTDSERPLQDVGPCCTRVGK